MATTTLQPPPHYYYYYFVVALQILLLLWSPVVVQSALTTTTTWCVARSDSSQLALQRALDYACGSGAADCSPILSNGLCYLPNTLQAHASYAFNSFYQRKAKAPGACDFSGTATVAASDPSYGSCVYPSSLRTAGGATPSVPTGTSSTPSIITNTPTIPLLTPPLDGVPESSGAASGPSSIRSRAFGILILVYFFLYTLS